MWNHFLLPFTSTKQAFHTKTNTLRNKSFHAPFQVTFTSGTLSPKLIESHSWKRLLIPSPPPPPIIIICKILKVSSAFDDYFLALSSDHTVNFYSTTYYKYWLHLPSMKLPQNKNLHIFRMKSYVLMKSAQRRRVTILSLICIWIRYNHWHSSYFLGHKFWKWLYQGYLLKQWIKLKGRDSWKEWLPIRLSILHFLQLPSTLVAPKVMPPLLVSMETTTDARSTITVVDKSKFPPTKHCFSK